MSDDFDSFLGRPQAKILILGTFHFRDRGLDKYKPQHSFEVFSLERQQEIKEVVSQLATFRPTKIAIERTPHQQVEIDQNYQAYLQRGPLSSDEVHQLGFRLAKRLAHPKVYCVNAWDRHYEPMVDVEAYAREHGTDFADHRCRASIHFAPCGTGFARISPGGGSRISEVRVEGQWCYNSGHKKPYNKPRGTNYDAIGANTSRNRTTLTR